MLLATGMVNNDDGIYLILGKFVLSFYKGEWCHHRLIERSPDGMSFWFWRLGIRHEVQ